MRNDKEISFGWSFCFAKNKKNCHTGYTRVAEISEKRPFAIDFHAHFDTIRV
jgi:hypothetical protein